MADHGSRHHATWSASATARNWACPGALALSAEIGTPDRENQWGAWGTACHQVAEICLSRGKDAADLLGMRVDTKEHTFEFDDEMAECTQAFLDYVRGRCMAYTLERGDLDYTVLIEQKFDLAGLDPPFQAGGTGDAVLLFPAWGLIEIVDLKTGRGVVEVEENEQLRTYALGALMANRDAGDWTKMRSTVVQPRAPHQDGAVRSEDYDVLDLLEWTGDLLRAMGRAKAAEIALQAFHRPTWVKEFLHPGDHCQWCLAAAQCPALAAVALEKAETFFQDEAVAVPPDPITLPVGKIVSVLDAADMIENWLNAIRAHARHLVEAGQTVGDYILVPKRAMRRWKHADDESRVLGELLDADLSPDEVRVHKLMSPAQVEKVLGAKRKHLIKDLWISESSGTNLVRADKTTREALPLPATKFFDIIEGN